ncbi:serine/threonine protein kinase [bacterium]|nr:serine/threonine protein kinase [bacterium]
MATLAVAEPGSARYFHINISGPAGLYRLRYKQTSAAHSEEDPNSGGWTEIKGGRQGTNTVQLPPLDYLALEVSQPQLFWEYRGQTVVSFAESNFDVKVHLQVRWLLVMAVLGTLLAGSFVFYRRRNLRQMRATIREQEPLIRSDGQVPKRKVGSYRLLEILGKGGMGVVYKAVSDDGILAAIKVPAPHLISEPDFEQRFLREIELGLRLKHPRVVQVLELPSNRELYLVMEFVEGTPLSALPIQPWATEQRLVLGWAEQALDALEFIHKEGIIHRDLKPANLMVLADKSLKLMDFGIAHKIHGTRLTGTGHILGTPIYMAPEQLHGQPIDPRADIYSLGVILYERLLPGLPFPEDTMELMRYKLLNPLQSLLSQGSRVSPEMDQFMNRMVAHNPDDRFQNATAALMAVRRLMRA